MFLETIQIKQGKLKNLKYHQYRVNKTFTDFFPGKEPMNLFLLQKLKLPNSGIYKLRFIYNASDYEVEIIPYKRKEIKSLKKIHNNNISYRYKFYDRSPINELLQLKQDCDDILIIKDNKITDTSFANIIFFDGRKWVTPASPLLKGTKRHKLLMEKKIFEQEIYEQDLINFTHFALINALLDEIIPVDIKYIRD